MDEIHVVTKCIRKTIADIDVLRKIPVDKVDIDKNKLNDIIGDLEYLLYFFKSDTDLIETYGVISNLEKYKYWLNDYKLTKYGFLIIPICNDLERLFSLNYKELIEKKNIYKSKVLFIIGNMGTGKSHGIANISQKLLEEGCHIPILIQASKAHDNKQWTSLLNDYFELPSRKSEKELFACLECVSESINRKGSKNNNPQIIVFVDGIDEIRPFSIWHDLIRQSVTLSKKYRNLKFCFSGRPEAFRDYKDNAIARKYIPEDGEADLDEILENYAKYFRIPEKVVSRAKPYLQTPLEIREYCRIFEKGKSNTYGLNNIIGLRLDIIAGEISQRSGIDKNKCKNYLVGIIQQIKETGIKKTEIKDYGSILLDVTMKTLCENGIVSNYDREKEDFSIETFFYPSERLFFDYYNAWEFYNDNQYSDDLIFPLDCSGSFLQIYATFLFQKEEKTFLNNHSLLSDIYDDEDLFLFTLRSTISFSLEECKKIRPIILKKMKEKHAYVVLAVNNLISIYIHNPNHPLGLSLLEELEHDKSISFAERDALINTPMMLNASDKWRYKNEIEWSRFCIGNKDSYNLMPSLLVYGLGCVDEEEREDIESKLFFWGKNNPLEFTKLLLESERLEDQQIQFFLISLCVSVYSVIKEKNGFLLAVIPWVKSFIYDNHWFHYGIRSKALVLLEEATKYAIIEKSDLEKYFSDNNIIGLPIPFSVKASSVRNESEGYSAITYDLSRYVLCSAIRTSIWEKADERVRQNLLNEIKTEYNLQTLNFEGLIIGLAYGYLKSTGWDESVFLCSKNGLDRSIRRRYPIYTHGSKSLVMSFSEKYIWQAKNVIIGYLIDRLQLAPSITSAEDYLQFDDQYNSYQTIISKKLPDTFSNVDIDFDYLPSLTINPIDDYYDVKSVYDRVQTEIDISNEELTKDKSILYAYRYFPSEKDGTSRIINVAAFLVDKQDESVLWEKAELRYDYVPDLQAEPKGNTCYFPAVEYIFGNRKEEKYSSMEIGGVTLHKTTSRCIYNNGVSSDSSMIIPSVMARDLFCIEDCNASSFFDSEGNIVCECKIKGNVNEGIQETFSITEASRNELSRNDYRLVWIVDYQTEVSQLVTLYNEYSPKEGTKHTCFLMLSRNNKWKRIPISTRC